MTDTTLHDLPDAAEARRIWEVTAEAWDQRHRLLRPEDWAKRTPCAAWDVRALVEHAIETQARYGQALGYDVGSARDWDSVRHRMAAGIAGDTDLQTGTVLARFGPGAATGLTLTPDAVWVTSNSDAMAYRVPRNAGSPTTS